jgi:hypothetical protein
LLPLLIPSTSDNDRPTVGSTGRIAIDVSKIREGQDRMRIMFTGIGGSGAWVMRGEQLAATRLNWSAIANAARSDLGAVDAVVVVKHISERALAALRNWGGPIIMIRSISGISARAVFVRPIPPCRSKVQKKLGKYSPRTSNGFRPI